MAERRFRVCPGCGDKEIEVLDNTWICWACEWEEPLTQEELDDRQREGA